MRLWPLCIIDQLPRQQLLGQHRECCALRGNGWGRKHSTVDYVFSHPYYWLYRYHVYVLVEMRRRGYKAYDKWWYVDYRGKIIGDCIVDSFCDSDDTFCLHQYRNSSGIHSFVTVYPEHDEKYLDECIENLRKKGITIDRKKAFRGFPQV